MLRMRRMLAGCLIAWAAAAWAAPAAAQPAADPAPGTDTVALEALRCWRRVAAHAVHVGERFDMLLTCAVVETGTARAVPDLARLEPATLGVSPFEVLDGERYDDVVRGPRRFFQYRYALRIIGADYFGLDVELPPLELRYRIERSLDGGAAAEGRELAYVLPPESIRVLSLVPAAAADIRELPGETFGDVEARLFRANLTGIAAAAIGVAAAGALLLGAARARREWRGAAAARADRVPAWRIARAALGELRAVRAAAEAEGWTGDLVARALAALRIAAALAVGRPVAQSAAGAGAGAASKRSAVRGRQGVAQSAAGAAVDAGGRGMDVTVGPTRAQSAAGAAVDAGRAADRAAFPPPRRGAAADMGSAVDAAGRLTVRRGPLRAERVSVWSALTARDLDAASPRVGPEPPADAVGPAPSRAVAVESLRAGLACFGAARYGAAAEAPGETLTAALEAGMRALQSFQVELFEPVGRASRLYRNCREWAADRWRP